MKKYLKLIRVKHYLKNVIVFLPLFFSSKLFDVNALLITFLGFIQYSFVSSIVYIINDIRDIDDDRKHDEKRKRPLASGEIKIKNAIIVVVLLALITIGIGCYLFILNGSYAFLLLFVYLILNILYSFGLKEKVIIDIVILASGFVLRLFYGGMINNIVISNYLFLTVLCGSLFMAIGKRRNELRKNGDKTRKVLKYYNIDFLSKNLYIYLAMTLIFFSLWTMSLENGNMILVIPLIYLICLKYSYNIENEDSFGDPVEVIFSDKLLLGCIALFAIIIFLIFYVFK